MPVLINEEVISSLTRTGRVDVEEEGSEEEEEEEEEVDVEDGAEEEGPEDAVGCRKDMKLDFKIGAVNQFQQYSPRIALISSDGIVVCRVRRDIL